MSLTPSPESQAQYESIAESLKSWMSDQLTAQATDNETMNVAVILIAKAATQLISECCAYLGDTVGQETATLLVNTTVKQLTNVNKESQQ